MSIIASNKKAMHDYFINNKYEAGLVLTGSEVKSLRINTGSIKESYIVEKEGELWLTNCFIKKYSSSSDQNVNTTRERKILEENTSSNALNGPLLTVPAFLFILSVTQSLYFSPFKRALTSAVFWAYLGLSNNRRSSTL